MIQKFPEDIGVYLSILFMSICRGDIASAKLAYRHISLYDKAAFYFRDILSKASLFHFSILPLEVKNVTLYTAWEVISGMCRSPLDKRALSLSIIEINGRTSNSRIALEFNKWLRSNKATEGPPQPLQKRLIQDAVRYLNKEANLNNDDFLEETSFFSSRSEDILKIDNINKIYPMYYLGDWSWMRRSIESSLFIINNMVDIGNIIDIFEINKPGDNIQFGRDYWESAKRSLFGSSTNVKQTEELWEMTLKPTAIRLIKTLQLQRIQTNG